MQVYLLIGYGLLVKVTFKGDSISSSSTEVGNADRYETRAINYNWRESVGWLTATVLYNHCIVLRSEMLFVLISL